MSKYFVRFGLQSMTFLASYVTEWFQLLFVM